MRDGIVIGVLLDHYGEIVIAPPPAPLAGGLRPSLLPSSIQLLRCTAEAVRRPRAMLLVVPAVRWSVSSSGSARIRGLRGILTRVDGSKDLPANRRSWVLDPDLGDDPRYSLVVSAEVSARRWWRRGDSNS